MDQLLEVDVGYRPQREDRCPQCGAIDADARVYGTQPVRMSISDGSAAMPEIVVYRIELRCERCPARPPWTVTWSFGPDKPLPQRFHAVGRNP